VAWVHERTTSTEWPPLVGEVNANIWGKRVSCGQSNGSPLPYSQFLDRSRYFFFQVAPQLCSRGWLEPVPDPLHLTILVAPGIEPGTSGSLARTTRPHSVTIYIYIYIYIYTIYYNNSLLHLHSCRQSCLYCRCSAKASGFQRRAYSFLWVPELFLDRISLQRLHCWSPLCHSSLTRPAYNI
jgi:hypothetical protein